MAGHDYLTTEEVAKRYRTSASTVRYWRMTGYLPYGTKFGRRTLYDRVDLDKWDTERQQADPSRAEPPASQ